MFSFKQKTQPYFSLQKQKRKPKKIPTFELYTSVRLVFILFPRAAQACGSGEGSRISAPQPVRSDFSPFFNMELRVGSWGLRWLSPWQVQRDRVPRR